MKPGQINKKSRKADICGFLMLLCCLNLYSKGWCSLLVASRAIMRGGTPQNPGLLLSGFQPSYTEPVL